MKKVLAFGTFDGLHSGHVHFLRQARRRGDYLVVAVASDATVLKLKKNPPRASFLRRTRALRQSGLADKIIRADLKNGSWNVIVREKPDVVVLGYDQKEIRGDLREKRKIIPHVFRIETAKAHRPRTFHSRKLKPSSKHH